MMTALHHPNWSPDQCRAGGPRPVPRLETERLVLDALTLADWPAYVAFMMSDRSDMMGGPYSVFDGWGWFCADMGGWAITGSGGLAVRHEGDLVGVVSLNDFPAFPELEIGWMLFDGAQGQGFATEAARALKDWTQTVVQPASLVSYIDPNNSGSIGVAERLGATHDPQAETPDPSDRAYRHWGQS